MRSFWLGVILSSCGIVAGDAAEFTVVIAPTASTPQPGEVATLVDAVAKVRATRAKSGPAPAVIELRGGRHQLSAPLELSSADSDLVIRPVPGEAPVVVGSVRLTGWTRSQTNPALWEVSLPQVRAGQWNFRQLFAAGKRQTRARTPNEGFFKATDRLGTNSPIALPFRRGDLDPAWNGRPGIEVILLMKWTDLHVPLTRVDSTSGIAHLPGGPRPYWMDEPNARYWVENVAEALDSPGEWYLDRTSGWLRWWPPEGVDPNETLVSAPKLNELVRLVGKATAEPVTRVEIQGIQFAETDYDLPEQGMISPQAAVPVPGTIRATAATDCAITDCRFELFGGYGLELGRGCQRWRIVGNEFLDLGAGGIRVGEPSDRTPSDAEANHGHQITDNSLRSLGRIFAPAVGIIVFQSGTNRIAYNHISDLYYTGISVGWNWGYQATPCRGNVIENNLVEQIGQGRLSDMGGIYTLGPQPGTIIRNNVFRDVESYGYGGWGLYTDEGSSGIVLENNVAYRCKSAGFHQHYGRDNVVRNNLLAFNREHELMRTRVESHRSFWFTNNVVIWDSGDLLGSSWDGTTQQFLLDGNQYFDLRLGTNRAAYRFAGQSFEEWRARGQDRNSVIADPQLIDPRRPELGFRVDTPYSASRFRPEELKRLGPRPRKNRD
ncbi:MAG TPA: right-handed parallel beta-helix repeat-containing protein [Verrucomicrobiota bacterium]|nr:hypothetical protein [Verrucomicrobiales bacterium]HRI14104.1 right-handed parallel beta-helix repeat-containing protein [Verrucomicrobiota bacterium]